MVSYPSELSLQNPGAMLKATSFESLLYGMLLLIQNDVGANQNHTLFRDTRYSWGVYDLDSRCIFHPVILITIPHLNVCLSGP